MQNRWKVLAPVDLSSQAEARVYHAVNVAEALQGDLTLLYIVNGRSKRAGRVEWPANAMAGHRNCEVRRLVLAGSVAETVGLYADDLRADLVTVTAGSYRWWDRLWRRSAAADIATATDRPVYFARLSAPAPVTAFRSILCVVALDGTDDPLIRFSEEVAQRCNAILILLHIVPDASEALLAFGVPGAEDRPLSREVAEQRMHEVTSALSLPHLTAVTTGPAYRSIANLAREHSANLVITGKCAATLSGIDTGPVLSRVSCPVISVAVGLHSLVGRGHAVPGSRYTAITGEGDSRMIA